jgi:REP element-mobilizing transposase RayT
MYHVINRGNYRADVFGSDGAKEAFLACVEEACAFAGWKVHGYVVMRNHYHLALETPEPTLVDGMQWLQSTYANRFNRFRGEHGHVFQGRYHAMLVEDGARMGAVCHYIHLNPVRAGIVPVAEVAAYRWSSMHLMMTKPKARPVWLSVEDALISAGPLPDTPAGHRAYVDYLAWLAGDEAAQKAFAFDKMSKGWVLGSAEFKRALIADHKQELANLDLGEAGLVELKQGLWDEALTACLKRLGKTREGALTDRKACLLGNHGQIAVGASPACALALAIEVEALADQYLRACAVAEPARLTDLEFADAVARFADYRTG